RGLNGLAVRRTHAYVSLTGGCRHARRRPPSRGRCRATVDGQPHRREGFGRHRQHQHGVGNRARWSARHRRQDRRANRGVPPEKRAVQANRGADERARRRREELPETEGPDYRRGSKGRSAPAVTVRQAGYTLVELTVVAALIATVSAVSVPPLLATIDDARTYGAARYLSTRLQHVRMEAIRRSADVGIKFTASLNGYGYTVYVDGNHNGIRTLE